MKIILYFNIKNLFYIKLQISFGIAKKKEKRIKQRNLIYKFDKLKIVIFWLFFIYHFKIFVYNENPSFFYPSIISDLELSCDLIIYVFSLNWLDFYQRPSSRYFIISKISKSNMFYSEVDFGLKDHWFVDFSSIWSSIW